MSLKDIGITATKMRKAANEGLIIEIPGPNGASLAGILQEKLQIALDDMARINKPAALSELRLAGIDPSITVDEICRDLATIGKCAVDDFSVRARAVQARIVCCRLSALSLAGLLIWERWTRHGGPSF